MAIANARRSAQISSTFLAWFSIGSGTESENFFVHALNENSTFDILIIQRDWPWNALNTGVGGMTKRCWTEAIAEAFR